MKQKRVISILAILLCAAMILSACTNGGTTSPDAGTAPVEPEVITEVITEVVTEVVEVFDPAQFVSWFYEEGTWRSPVNRVEATNWTAGFIEDASGRPSYADLEIIMNTASLASSARGRTPWYMVVVTDTETQNAITQSDAPGVPRLTSDGTVTVLIFGEWLLDEQYRTDTVKTFFPREGYINVGILSAYLNVAAISMGYSTRMFMTLASPNAPLGERWPEVEPFIVGREYTWGSTGDAYTTDNMKFAIAVVIGTMDETIESGATVAGRPHNWSFWDGVAGAPVVLPTPLPAEVIELEDGVFEGSADGYNGEIVVRVTVENGEIADIEIIAHEEDELFMSMAAEDVIAQILTAQTVAGIDTVAGATEASEGIINAVASALAP